MRVSNTHQLPLERTWEPSRPPIVELRSGTAWDGAITLTAELPGGQLQIWQLNSDEAADVEHALSRIRLGQKT